MFTVPLRSQKMQIPSIPQPGQDTNLVVSPKTALALQVGDIVQAQVLTVTDTATAIRMKSNILEAKTNVPLKEGETITLIVESKGNELRLRLLPSEGGDVASLKSTILSALATLKGAKPAAEDLKVLGAFIKNLSADMKALLPELQALEKLLPSLSGLSGSALKEAVQGSGVFFETKLRLLVLHEGQDTLLSDAKLGEALKNDLKAALMELRDAVGKSAVADTLLRTGVKTDSLMAAVDSLLKNIEVLQLQSRLNNTLQVFLPFVWQDLREGNLVFRESEQEQEGKRAYSCTVNLDLEHAGKMSARVLLQSEGIHVNIVAENEQFANVLQENAELLRNQFERAGLLLGSLTIQQPGAVSFTSAHANGLNIRV
jgi:hypothetical protein